ncbi:MAG: hypothetical protein OQK09_04435 [Colwellia sp.]|nr:hypothetical protein [Colwellia sp.]MCW8865364.1 hypothetical protein [Colwellia sp.]MCW9080736.1 hypothetical protein [Colwellia sp.]
MLSSIILSMAMSVSPASIADNQSFEMEEIGAVRGTRRLSSENTIDIEEAGAVRGTRRL